MSENYLEDSTKHQAQGQSNLILSKGLSSIHVFRRVLFIYSYCNMPEVTGENCKPNIQEYTLQVRSKNQRIQPPPNMWII